MVTSSALVFVIAGHPIGAEVLLGLVIVAAGLESIFAGLMRIGWVPEATCEACNNIALRG